MAEFRRWAIHSAVTSFWQAYLTSSLGTQSGPRARWLWRLAAAAVTSACVMGWDGSSMMVGGQEWACVMLVQIDSGSDQRGDVVDNSALQVKYLQIRGSAKLRSSNRCKHFLSIVLNSFDLFYLRYQFCSLPLTLSREIRCHRRLLVARRGLDFSSFVIATFSSSLSL